MSYSQFNQRFGVLVERLNRLQSELNRVSKQDTTVILYICQDTQLPLTSSLNNTYVLQGSIEQLKLPANADDGYKIKLVSRANKAVSVSTSQGQRIFNELLAPADGTDVFFLWPKKLIEIEFYAGEWNLCI